LHKEINKFLVNLNTLKLKDKYAITVGVCYKTINCLWRISNLSKDIAFTIKQHENDEKYFDDNNVEINLIFELVEKILTEAYELFEDNEYSEKKIKDIEDLNEKIANLTQTNKELLKSDFAYIRILNNLKRIGNHAVCIAKALEYKKD